MSAVVTRFAPSPTGRLHLGHAFSAIRSHDRARSAGGRFLLRIEDIDGTRSRADHVAGIFEDLKWLGLEWNGDVLFQSARLDVYAAALAQLKLHNLIYPCFCTRADIAASVAAPHGPEGAVYPGTCRNLDVADRERRVAAEPHAWRLDMARALAAAMLRHPELVSGSISPMAKPVSAALNHIQHDGILEWRDELVGPVVADPAAHGDVVLARKDAPASYHLAVTIDDAFQNVTHVVRGEDLRAATDVHRLLQALLDLPVPVYHHHALLTDAAGRRLAKREGAPTLESVRAQGMDARALADLLRAGRLPIGFGVAAS